jgi:hypothetical protein
MKLVVLHQTLLRSLGILVLLAAAALAVMAQTPTSIVLISGKGRPGERDAANQFSLNPMIGIFHDAYIVEKDPNYDTIPDTNFISASWNGWGFPDRTIRYRTMFQLPEGFSSPSLTVDIHTDNVATIFLKGTVIGQQIDEEHPRNYQNPAESYTTTDAALFQSGNNLLDFDIKNYKDPSGFAYRAVVTFTPPLSVAIDIKPGAFPNTINLGSNGNVPVAILSSASFDATTVEPLTVKLAGASVALKGNGTPVTSVQDVNGDGLMDLVVHVETEALELSETDTQANLVAYTSSGLGVTGSDSVRIVPN